MKHLSTLATAAWLVSALAAQEGIPTHDPLSAAWQSFLADQAVRTSPQEASTWTSKWNKATGTPKAIYGPGLRVKDGRIVDVSEARALAGDLLDRHADLLGRGDSQFVEATGQKVRQVYVLVYDQHYAGLPVIGGRADVRLHEIGVASMFGSQAVQIPAGFGTKPSVTAAYAWAMAHDHLSVQPQGDVAGLVKPAAELVIHADVEGRAPTFPRLAWQVQVDVRDSADVTVGKVYVDARTGQVIQWVDEVYRCWMGHEHISGESLGHESADEAAEAAPVARGHLGKAIAAARAGDAAPLPVPITGNVRSWLNRGQSPLNALTNQTLQGIRVTASGAGSAFTDANGDFSIPYSGTNPVTVSVNFASGAGERMSGGITFNTGSAVSGSASITPGTPGQIQMLTAGAVTTDWSQPTVFWHVDDVNRWVESLTGGYGGTRFNINGMRGVVNINSTCNAFYTGNSINFYNAGGGCNMTAFSSVVYHEWGHGADDAFGGISQTDGLSEGWGDILSIYRLGDPIVGRDFTTSGGIVRNANNTTQYPAGGNWGGAGVHTQGQSWMGFAWTVRNNLIASLGQQAGIATAEQIVVGTLPADATNQPDAVREVFILDDDDGNLANGVPHYSELSAAAQSRSLPFPEVQVGSITHTVLSSTTEAFTPQIARAVVAPVSGSFQSVSLVYNIGIGPMTRPMVPSGATNEYIALVPGIAAPGAVQYHIEARHSTNVTLRFPESGEIGYSVGNDAVIFSENFDGGSPGWTHAQVATQDDWQNGAPQGRSGTSNGVAWRDPAAAVSGASIYGNDLGPAGFNGAYQPNVHNYLRSPTINCSGESGVKLRFKRWLTVEEAIYDQAQIRVNGVVVWQNPLNGNLVDTSWQDFELPIPTADNNPAVNIEFRLITDGGLNLGGWNIDDFEVLAARQTQAPPVEFTLTPSQIPLGGSAVLSFSGDPVVPAAILISDNEGPTPLPNGPDLDVGMSNLIVLPVVTDSNGDFSATVSGSNNPADTGMLFYTQVIQVVAGQVEKSNKGRLLFGN